MSKPRQTIADYMVIAISPALIMALVGSLCFFLIEVFYRGRMMGMVCWVMFWFVIGIVMVSRIAIENSAEHAAMYGFGLAFATWLYMMRTQSSYLLGVVLLAVVWFCAHKLVWDCTLIDDDEDSSGQGLLQKAPAPAVPPSTATPAPAMKAGRKKPAPHSPGRWVIYFSLAALPLFGVGQMLLPADAAGARRSGFIFLAVYLGAALGLLVTTSFLGLRRYLRQRYLKMPLNIGVAWLKFGVGAAALVLIGALFLPRPGANAAWATLRYQVDYQLRRASEYAAAGNPPGRGKGRPGDDPGGKQGNAPKPSEEHGTKKSAGEAKPGPNQSPPQTNPALETGAAPSTGIYNLLRIAFLVIAVLVVVAWIVRHWQMLWEMIRSGITAIAEFFRKFLLLTLPRPAVQQTGPVFVRPRLSSFAEYKNPFFATGEHVWPPEQIIIYSYEAVQVWAKEQGVPARPEETAREFCARLGEQYAELRLYFIQLARLYAHAAYGTNLPANSDLEPVRELWRQLPSAAVHTVGDSR